MKKILVVVDMQNDFISGALGSAEAEAIVPRAVRKIRSWQGDLACTLDTHGENYLETSEGRHLPVPHCIAGTPGHELDRRIADALGDRAAVFEKNTFGSPALASYLLRQNYDSIQLIGLCTDICVVSNAMLIKAFLPEADVSVDPGCCAGVTPASHEAALQTMRMCQIGLSGEEG